MSLLGLSALAGSVGQWLDELFTSDDERLTKEALLRRAQNELPKLELEIHRKMAEITESETKHASVFVAGWRASLGWVCSLGLLYSFIIQPIAQDLIYYYGLDITLTSLQTSEMVSLIATLLGFGGLRTIEKIKGVQRDSLK